MSPQLFHVATAIAFLLVTCHAGHDQKGTQNFPGLNGLSAKEEKPGLKPGRPGPPGFLGPVRGPPGKDEHHGPQESKGEQGKKGERGPPGQPGFALNGTIKNTGKKMFNTTGQEGDFQTTLEACKRAGGSIASPRNKEENDAVLKIVNSHNKSAFLGIKHGGIPGTFTFLDGTALNYTNWHAGEPIHKGEENCIQMCTKGAWNDTSCSQYRLIICEF